MKIGKIFSILITVMCLSSVSAFANGGDGASAGVGGGGDGFVLNGYEWVGESLCKKLREAVESGEIQLSDHSNGLSSLDEAAFECGLTEQLN